MAIALVSKAEAYGINGATTSGIDTTTATLIVLTVSGETGADVTPTDSKSNTWSALTIQTPAGGGFVRIYYCNPGSKVDASHTFTVSTAGGAYVLNALAFSGTLTSSVFDTGKENGATTAGATSLASGSITPSEDNCVLVTAVFANQATGVTTPSGYTAGNEQDFGSGVNYAGGAAYLIQTTAGASNPSWTWTGSNRAAAVVAVFKPAVDTGNTDSGTNTAPGNFRTTFQTSFSVDRWRA